MFYETEYTLDGIRSKITIEYLDDSLISYTIVKNSHTMKMAYINDEIYECVVDHHDMKIVNGLLVGNIMGSEYINGHIVLDSIGMVYDGNKQTYTNGLQHYKLYKGLMINDKLFYEDDWEPKHDYSDEMLFLLSLSNGCQVPYDNIINLPPFGLREFITVMGDIMKDGIYLTYMDKLFSGFPGQLVMTSDSDPIDDQLDTTIHAKLGPITMMMISHSDGSYNATIVDDKGEELSYNQH